jgi:hypothetical protein
LLIFFLPRGCRHCGAPYKKTRRADLIFAPPWQKMHPQGSYFLK